MNKHIYLYILLLIFILPLSVFGQGDFVCVNYDTTTTVMKTLSSSTYPGFRKASTDTLRMLLVFVREKDDALSMTEWPADSDPINMQQYLSSNPHTIPLNEANNFSSYFKVSSNNNFIVWGEVLSIELSKKLSNYATGNNLSVSTWFSAYLNSMVEVCDSVFNRLGSNTYLYDNWNYGYQNFIKNADGILDFVLVVYKSFPYSYAGFINMTIDSKSNNYGQTINTSSIAFTKPLFGSLKDGVIKIGVHELGHYILSNQHSYYQGAKGNYNYHSIFGGGILHSQINAFEKEKLGWTTVPEITSSQVIELSPFTTTGDAVKLNTGNNTYT